MKSMYRNEPLFLESPDEDSKLWRYIDLPKFLSVLGTSSLFFCRADYFEDPYEGLFPKYNPRYVDAQTGRAIPEKNGNLASFKHFKQFMDITCWHESEYESEAMWKLYAKTGEGVAIQTTFARLRDSFANTPETVNIGRVKYIDFDHDDVPRDFSKNIYDRFMYKRKSFEHEKEVRALYFDGFSYVEWGQTRKEEENKQYKRDNAGTYISVDLDILIEKIYVSPLAGKWYLDVIKQVCGFYGISEERITQSNLYDEPNY